MIRRVFQSPFFWLLLFFLIAELAADVINPYLNTPYAADVSRNPTPLRSWPEYLRAKPGITTAGKNVAIISNSQGAGKEMANPAFLYTAQLEQNFKLSGLDINIENWSLAGLRSGQIELLSMIAAQRNLDLLVIIAEIKSLDVKNSTRLGANGDDLDLVAGDRSLWPEIRNSQLLGKTKWNELLHRFLLLNSDLIRLRPYLLDILAQEAPPVTHRLIFGHRRSQHALKSVNLVKENALETEQPTGTRSRQDPKNFITVPASTWQKQFERNRLPTFHQLYPGLQQRLAGSDTKLLWLWMPVYPGASTVSLRQAAEPVYSTMCDEIIASGSTCINLTNSLPAENFITLSTSSHFNAVGHKAMSQLLRPVIENALY